MVISAIAKPLFADGKFAFWLEFLRRNYRSLVDSFIQTKNVILCVCVGYRKAKDISASNLILACRKIDSFGSVLVGECAQLIGIMLIRRSIDVGVNEVTKRTVACWCLIAARPKARNGDAIFAPSTTLEVLSFDICHLVEVEACIGGGA